MQQRKDLITIFDNLKISSLYGAHIFIDYSNIQSGANRYCDRFDVDKFLTLLDDLTSSQPHIKKIAVSSIPFEAEKFGYEVHKLPKLKRKEIFVDELLYAKIGDSILDYEKGLLIVVTGDGNLSNYGLGFSLQIVRAVQRNWTVRLLGWKRDISSIYKDIEQMYSNFSIFYLDSAKHKLST